MREPVCFHPSTPFGISTGALEIIQVLCGKGFQALLAGGCVRDLLLGKMPHDFDVATSASPEDVARLFSRTIPVGAQFGVMLVVLHGEQYQVATFRSDGAYIDGRRPESVVFSSPAEDAARRDFTVNGLFYDPVKNEVIDFVGGLSDLKQKILRAIGDPERRFAEDKLRLLRAVRFAATLDFEIDPSTLAAICHHAHEIQTVSPERIREELCRMFAAPQRVRALDLLEQTGLLKEVLPEVAALRGCEQPPEFHPEGDVYVHTRLMLSLLSPNAPLPVVLSVLFHDIGKPGTSTIDPETGRIRFNGHESLGAAMAERIMERLRFSNQEIAEVTEMVKNHMAFKDVKQMRKAKLRRFLARPTIEGELELHRVDCLSSHGLLENYEFLLARREEFANEPLVPPRLLTGRDLIALGWQPGPRFKIVLDAVQNAQLEGQIHTKEEALDWVRSHFPES
jgi:poly(A) polymerase